MGEIAAGIGLDLGAVDLYRVGGIGGAAEQNRRLIGGIGQLGRYRNAQFGHDVVGIDLVSEVLFQERYRPCRIGLHAGQPVEHAAAAALITIQRNGLLGHLVGGAPTGVTAVGHTIGGMNGIHPYLVFRRQLGPPLDDPFKRDLAVGEGAVGFYGDHIHQLILYHGLGVTMAVGQHGIGGKGILSILIFLNGGPLRFRHKTHLHTGRIFTHQSGRQLHHLPGGAVQIIVKAHSAAAIHVVGKGGFAFGEIVIGEEQPVRGVFFKERPEFFFDTVHDGGIKAGVGYQLCAVIGRFQIKEAIDIKPPAPCPGDKVIQRVKNRIGGGSCQAVICCKVLGACADEHCVHIECLGRIQRRIDLDLDPVGGFVLFGEEVLAGEDGHRTHPVRNIENNRRLRSRVGFRIGHIIRLDGVGTGGLRLLLGGADKVRKRVPVRQQGDCQRTGNDESKCQCEQQRFFGIVLPEF